MGITSTSSVPSRSSPWRSLLLVIAVIPAFLAACSSASETGELPRPALTDLTTGKKADWPTDRPLVINVWATWCTPCRKEMPAFQAVHEQLGDRVAIVGVSDDPNLDGSRKAAKVAGVTYPLLVDVDTRLMVDLGIAGLPATVFVDKDGKVLGKRLGAMTEDQLRNEIEKRYDIAP